MYVAIAIYAIIAHLRKIQCIGGLGFKIDLFQKVQQMMKYKHDSLEIKEICNRYI